MSKKYEIQSANGYYPIIYVRGFATGASEREEIFYDTYYSFSATSVEKREAPPPKYFEADVFEGQLIRLMKMKGYGYADAANRGLEDFHDNPTRSIWICRFYDKDFFDGKLREITKHAAELYELICNTIPKRLKGCNVDLGKNDKDYKVILIAHSMGGLVCRTLIQNVMPSKNKDPKTWVHRLITMGTPHKGIELGSLPDSLVNFILKTTNIGGAKIFNPEQMNEYLNIDLKYEPNSLGSQNTKYFFPVKRCLCLIGSDYLSYAVGHNLVKEVVGNFSDGLVKQDRAYVVGGQKPDKNHDYTEDMKCFWANVHRSHSGRRGIVNSYESFENIQRFLFGNIKADIYLESINIKTSPLQGFNYFYDFEFMITIRKTNVYLHRMQQDPCENAIRKKLNEIPASLFLHTLFMNSNLKEEGSGYSHFSFKIRVIERRIKDGFLWDHEYPERPIYNETGEVRVGDIDPNSTGVEVEYRWLSDIMDWERIDQDNNLQYRIPLRSAGSIFADIVIKASAWPDKNLTKE